MDKPVDRELKVLVFDDKQPISIDFLKPHFLCINTDHVFKESEALAKDFRQPFFVHKSGKNSVDEPSIILDVVFVDAEEAKATPSASTCRPRQLVMKKRAQFGLLLLRLPSTI
ncbi:MAG: hypothetical protein ABJN34_12675 [Litoreibacter sp.]|uniref:hypothetical protein n=1 Tax=Litoreibacter sp. TaxID=1969459 RepID=UPI003298D155